MSGNHRGDAWVTEDDPPSHVFFWNGHDWTDGGQLRGPTGPRGAQGEVGPEGEQGTEGPPGVEGPQGPQGSRGPTGAQGPRGTEGRPGVGISLMGSVPTEADLPQACNCMGNAFVTEDTQHLWFWNGCKWVDLGNFAGPAGPPGAQGVQGPEGATGSAGSFGPQGQRGVQGPRGVEGPQGGPGTSVAIMGVANHVGELPDHGHLGDGWITENDSHLWVWDGDDWFDTGVIQGPQGVRGPEGQEGPPGIQGVRGLEGPAGVRGAQGVQGPAGPRGIPGPAGAGVCCQGFVQTSGDLPQSGKPCDAYIAADGSMWVWSGSGWQNVGRIQGPQGPEGPGGSEGPPGLQGVQGPPGPIGSEGPRGPQGPLGPVGPVGPQGPAGIGIHMKGEVATEDDLPAGLHDPGDAYITADTGDLWVWSGTGWVNAGRIVGPQGPIGPQGPKGDKGDRGPEGPEGDRGPMGPQGPRGPQGERGPQGVQGQRGPQGPTGPQGPRGPQGAVGPGVNIKGEVPTENDLPMTGNQPGDAYIITETGHVWIWQGNGWVNGGHIVGPEGPPGIQGPPGEKGLGIPAGDITQVQWNAGPGPEGENIFGASPNLTWVETGYYPTLNISGLNGSILQFGNPSNAYASANFFFDRARMELALTVSQGAGTFVVDNFTNEVIRRTYMSLREGEPQPRFNKPSFVPDFMLMLANAQSYLSFCSDVGDWSTNYTPLGSWIQAHTWSGAQPLKINPWGGDVSIVTQSNGSGSIQLGNNWVPIGIWTTPTDYQLALQVNGTMAVTGWTNSYIQGLRFKYDPYENWADIEVSDSAPLRIYARTVGFSTMWVPVVPYPEWYYGGFGYHVIIGGARVFGGCYGSFLDLFGAGLGGTNMLGGIVGSDIDQSVQQGGPGEGRYDDARLAAMLYGTEKFWDNDLPGWANAYTGYLSFQTRGAGGLAERMIINSRGFVGINRADPQSRLDMYGVAHFDGSGWGDWPQVGDGLYDGYPLLHTAGLNVGYGAGTGQVVCVNVTSTEATLQPLFIDSKPLWLNCSWGYSQPTGDVNIGAVTYMFTQPPFPNPDGFNVNIGPPARSGPTWLNLSDYMPAANNFFAGISFTPYHFEQPADARVATIEGWTGDGLEEGFLVFSTRGPDGLQERMRINADGIDMQARGLMNVGQITGNYENFSITAPSYGTVWLGVDGQNTAFGVNYGNVVSYVPVIIYGDLTVVDGELVCLNFRTTDPGAGSKKFWADPSDGHRIKFAV